MNIFDRIRNKEMRDLVIEPKKAAKIIKNNMTIGFSGLTGAGYPKVIPKELVERAKQGEKLQINLVTGASVGPEIDDEMSKVGIIKKRIPFQTSRELRKIINKRKTKYVEIQLEKLPNIIKKGWLGNIDIAVIEALAINEKGYIIPTTSVGITPLLIEFAKEIIIEINVSQPEELEGIHDIYLPKLENPEPIPLKKVNERIGKTFIKCDRNKIKYIVKSEKPDTPDNLKKNDLVSIKIAQNLFNFLELEIENKRLTRELRPIQFGIGNVANSVVSEFEHSNFKNLQFYCGVLQEGIFKLFDKGKVLCASGGALSPTKKVLSDIINNRKEYQDKVVLRPMDISNNVEVINRLGIIAISNALEMDIYGNANLSHLLGSQVINGIGGGTTFCTNAYLSIMTLSSTSKDGKISNFVPMIPHCDIISHNIDVVVSDIGVADLRGKDPVEKAYQIINNCVESTYKELLLIYLKNALRNTGGHKPILLDKALSFHINYKENKTMK